MKRFSPPYWNLIREIAVTSFKIRFKTSVLGFFWSLAKPLALLGVIYVVFGKILKCGLPFFPLYLLLGIVTWNFFAEGTMHAMTCPIRKEGLFDKVYFPREIVLLGDSLMILKIYALNIAVFMAFYFAYGLRCPSAIPSLLAAWVLLFLLILGIGALGAAWITRYRDLLHIWEIALQLWFWATPVYYGLQQIPEPYRRVYQLSPVTRLLTTIRASFLPDPVLRASGALSWTYNLKTAALVLPVFALGVWAFLKRAPRFAEEL